MVFEQDLDLTFDLQPLGFDGLSPSFLFTGDDINFGMVGMASFDFNQIHVKDFFPYLEQVDSAVGSQNNSEENVILEPVPVESIHQNREPNDAFGRP